MVILSSELKHNRQLFHTQVPNENGLDIRLFDMGDSQYIGAIIVTRAFHNTFRGHLVRCTPEEYENGALTKLSMEDIGKYPSF